MKSFLLPCSLLFSVGSLLAVSLEPPVVIDVDATTFQVTGHDLPLSLLLERATSDDEALFGRLVAMVADSTAVIAASQHIKTLSGISAQSQSVREQPYPTNFKKTNRADELFASFFEYKNCGSSFNGHLLAPHDLGGGSFGTFEIQSVRGDKMSRWPVSLPYLACDGGINFTEFATFSSVGPFRSADASQHLLSVTEIFGSSGNELSGYYLSFGRVAPRFAAQAKPSTISPPLLRLHALSFQISVARGRQLLQSRSSEGDRLLLENLLTLMSEGTALQTHHALLHVDQVNVRLDAEIPRDPFKSGSAAEFSPKPPDNTSQLEVIREFTYPTEYNDELYPTSFANKNLGQTFEATVVQSDDPSSIRIAMVMEHVRQPELRTWPELTDRSIPKVYQPIFCSTRISSSLQVRPGGVYCMGAILLPDYFLSSSQPEQMMEISLVQVDGRSQQGNAPPVSSQKELEYEVLSLTETDAAELLPLINSPDTAKKFLENAVQTGAAHSVAFCLLPSPFGKEKSEVSAQAELPYPTRSIRIKDQRLALKAWRFLTAGSILGTEASESGKFGFRHHLAPYALSITDKTLEEAADGNGNVEEPLSVTLEATIPTKTGAFQISKPEHIKAPVGHPEEGRWQVSVIQRR